MNLIEPNHQINMTSDPSVTSNNLFRNHLRVSTCPWHCSSCAKLGDSTSVSVASVMWMYEGDIDSASGKNWKEPSSSISTEASFDGHSNKESLNVNKICWQQ